MMIRFAAVLPLVLSSAALAQGVGNRDTAADIIVTASTGSLTAPSLAHSRARLERVPGATGFVSADSFADTFTQSLGDALLWTPGVFADTSAPRESRISIRGSGLNSGFERRGLTVLRDGVPITRASGSTEFQEVDPASIQHLEVLKGANGLRYGAPSLGGAIAIVSPTGLSAPGVSARIEGGSFGTVRGNVQLGGQAGAGDFWVGVTGLASDGFRDHSAVRGLYGFGNVGLRLSDRVETRVHLTALQDHFELSGALSLKDALANPRQSGRPGPGDPGPAADDWDRNLSVIRLANRTVVDLGGASLRFGGWYAWRGLDHAITRFAGIIDQSEDEVGASVEIGNGGARDRERLEWVLGVQANSAATNARTFANADGRRGALRSWSAQDASGLSAYGQLDYAVTPALRLIGGGHYARVVRDVEARLNAVSGRRTYSQFSPRIGLLLMPADGLQLFANVSRSFEPPSLADLTAGGAAPFAPLDPQRATSYEAGARGQRGIIAFDLAAWRADVRGEFIDQLAANGRTSHTVNADRTRRQGIEAAVDLFLAEASGKAGVGLVARMVWTLNDFRFVGDPVHGDNALAGVPRHVIVSELRLDGASGWYLGGTVRWVPEGAWVDYANSVRSPGHDIWGLTLGWQVTQGIRLFASAENLFDTRYIATISTTANQSRENAAAFTPGQGRALFAGASARF